MGQCALHSTKVRPVVNNSGSTNNSLQSRFLPGRRELSQYLNPIRYTVYADSRFVYS